MVRLTKKNKATKKIFLIEAPQVKVEDLVEVYLVEEKTERKEPLSSSHGFIIYSS